MRFNWTDLGLPEVLNMVPTLTIAGICVAAVFLAMSYSKGHKDLRFMALSALAYALVPMWPLVAP